MIDITLSIEGDGEPFFRIKHMDKSNELDQKLLGIFIKKAIESGVELKGVSCYLEAGKPESSHEIYKIIIKK